MPAASSPKMAATTPVALPTSPLSTPRHAGGSSPAFEDNLASSEAVQVYVRVRPPIERETALESSMQVTDRNSVVVQTSNGQELQCMYDRVFPPETTQLQIYEVVKDGVADVLQGFNCTIFAYGQTGSGKTHTMFGPDGAVTLTNGTVNLESGVVPRAVKDIFRGVQASGKRDGFQVFCSMVQIYNESVFDLLRDPRRTNALDIHENATDGIFVEGLSEYAVRSTRDTLQLLALGDQNRALRSTEMNQHSSRSHTVFQLHVEQRSEAGNLVRAKLNLVDLAGSERWRNNTMAEAHVNELTAINTSLHCLGRCIAALAKGRGHVPYRDSRLTRLLQDSLGGNTRTRVIATLSPAADCVDETVSTLKFADRAKQVMVTVHINEQVPVDQAYVRRLQREIAHLCGQLAGGGGGGSGGGDGGNEQIQFLERELVKEREISAALRAQLERAGHTPTIGASDTYKHAGFLPSVPDAEPPASLQVPKPPPGPSPLAVQLKGDNDKLAAALRDVKQAAADFFSFTIEEDGLKERLEAACAQGKAAHQNSVRAFKSAPASASVSPSGSSNGGSASTGSIVPRMPALSKRGGAPAVGAGFRVRGKTGVQVVEADEDAEEIALKRELKEAKKKMKKQLKLQEWLREKEERELAALREHEDQLRQQFAAQQAREEKFRKRAAATKKRVADYRQKLREDAIAECALDLDIEAEVPMSA